MPNNHPTVATRLEFPPLTVTGVTHGFTLRGACAGPPEVAAGRVLAEQVHGNLAACVSAADGGATIPGADALITQERGLALVIRTADCGPVFFYDAARGAVGLAHSGKKGTALNITGMTVSAMAGHFGSRPRDLTVVLGPCIRPPHYEVDFAAVIGEQARAAGVGRYYDCGLDTAADRQRFYSYRMESGKTGRHYAFIMLRAGWRQASLTNR